MKKVFFIVFLFSLPLFGEEAVYEDSFSSSSLKDAHRLYSDSPSDSIRNATPFGGPGEFYLFGSTGVSVVPNELVTSNLIFHLDKSSYTSLGFNGLAISTWSDISGSDFDVFQDVVSSQPANEFPFVNFNGTNTFMSAGDQAAFEFTKSTQIHVTFVYRSTATNPSAIHVAVGKQESGGGFIGWTVRIRGDVANDPWEFSFIGGTASGNLQVRFPRDNDTDIHVVAINYDGSASASGVRAWVDGVEQVITTVTNTLNNATVFTNAANFNVGARNSTELFFPGGFGEMVIYTASLTNAQISQNNDFLVGKWVTDFPQSLAMTLAAASIPFAASDVPVVFEHSFSANEADLRLTESLGDDAYILDGSFNKVPHNISFSRILSRDNTAWTFANQNSARLTDDGFGNAVAYIAWYNIDDNHWYIGQYRDLTGTFSQTDLGLSPNAQSDDHNNPTLAFDSEGHIYACAVEHNQTTLRLFKSVNPADISAFTETNLNSIISGANVTKSYCFMEITTTDRIYVSWRDETNTSMERMVSYSDDGGSTWTAAAELIDAGANERPYMHWKMAGTGLLHIAFSNDHPDEITAGSNDIYHAYLDTSDNTFHKTDGTLLGTLGSISVSPSTSTLVDDATTNGFNFWTYDIEVDVLSGRPAIVYSEERTPDNTDYRIRYARWDGSAWDVQELAASGHGIQVVNTNNDVLSYAHGVALLDVDTAFVVERDTNGVSGLHRYVTDDDGASFTETTIVRHAGKQIIRPMAFRGSDSTSDFQVVYMLGYYTHYAAPYLDNEIAIWPGNSAMATDVWTLMEHDTDGSTDISMRLYWGGSSYETQRSSAIATGTLYRGFGEMGTFVVDVAPVELNALGNVTAAFRFNQKVDNTENRTIFSDWTDTPTTTSHILLRINGSQQVNGVWMDSANATVSSVSTDLVTTTGVYAGAAFRYAAGTPQNAMNGTLSSVTGAGAATLDTAGTPSKLVVSYSPHTDDNNTDEFIGSVQTFMLFNSAKTDDWMRAATLGLGGDAVTAD